MNYGGHLPDHIDYVMQRPLLVLADVIYDVAHYVCEDGDDQHEQAHGQVHGLRCQHGLSLPEEPVDTLEDQD